MLSCPDVKSEVVVVYSGNKPVGYLVVYWNKTERGVSGRIVHIPDMGKDLGSWISVVEHAETMLRRKGCRSITAMASHPMLSSALHKCGYFRSGTRNVWLYDPSGTFSNYEWHLTFLEGDAGYRGV